MARSGSKIDVFIKLSLVFCISLLTFSMGAYVGKQMTETEFKRKQLEVEYSQNMNTDNPDSIPAIADEEVTKLAEEMVKVERQVASEHEAEITPEEHKAEVGHNEKHPAEPIAAKPAHKSKTTEAAATETQAKQKAEHKADPVETAAHRVAKSLAPAKDPKPARQPSTQLPSVATSAIGKYTVQVASYANEAEAKDHTSKLKDKGFPAFYVPAEVQGKNWYRVSVGLFTAQKAAMDYRQEILKTQASTTAIVQKIIK